MAGKTPLMTLDERRARQRRAMVMRAQGASWGKIAEALGYSGRDGAYRSVQSAMAPKRLPRWRGAYVSPEERLQLVECARQILAALDEAESRIPARKRAYQRGA